MKPARPKPGESWERLRDYHGAVWSTIRLAGIRRAGQGIKWNPRGRAIGAEEIVSP